jgi:hypothetical protein
LLAGPKRCHRRGGCRGQLITSSAGALPRRRGSRVSSLTNVLTSDQIWDSSAYQRRSYRAAAGVGLSVVARLPARPGVEFRRRLRAIASGRLLLPPQCNACRQRYSLAGRILHVAHEFEAKAKKQSRTSPRGSRVVIDAGERRIPSNHSAGQKPSRPASDPSPLARAVACSHVWPGKPRPKTMPIPLRHHVRLGRRTRSFGKSVDRRAARIRSTSTGALRARRWWMWSDDDCPTPKPFGDWKRSRVKRPV